MHDLGVFSKSEKGHPGETKKNIVIALMIRENNISTK